MRILLTNDDGINATGLTVLQQIAEELAGPIGEIWVVAPAFEQSGVAHCISYITPMMITQVGERRWTTEGSPADCVIAALHEVMTQSPPDLILSGVNRGNNAAENALYSGTLGGAMEGALQGYTAFALSQYYGPSTQDMPDPFEAARQHGADVIRRVLNLNLPRANGYQLFFNVNFPPVSASAVRGIQVAPQGVRPNSAFGVHSHKSPSGRRFLWVTGPQQQHPSQAGTDADQNLKGFISITPMSADLTQYDAVNAMKTSL
ncbi:MAG: 5'/3'-nucleotidase SurE [Aestuariivita sp.]|nr:5'/3'-nucleotidase SurE [Aestuariivita sp.]MCY4201951.1 5'/3'-nucleotidase SurE [Aestuariivita sp.]